jgi:hypothetical protein
VLIWRVQFVNFHYIQHFLQTMLFKVFGVSFQTGENSSLRKIFHKSIYTTVLWEVIGSWVKIKNIDSRLSDSVQSFIKTLLGRQFTTIWEVVIKLTWPESFDWSCCVGILPSYWWSEDKVCLSVFTPSLTVKRLFHIAILWIKTENDFVFVSSWGMNLLLGWYYGLVL